MIRILLVRHGETEWNKEHRLQGHSDIPLAETGSHQARITGSFVRDQNPVQGYVSPLQRTHQTFAEFGLDVAPQVLPDLAEQHLGEWEGWYGAEVREQFPEQFEGWRAGSFTPAGGESHPDLLARMKSAFFSIVRATSQIPPTPSVDLSFDLRTVVAVSHGAAIRVLLEGLGLIDRHQFIPLTPASVTIIDVPLHYGQVASSLPKSGLDDERSAEAEARLIAGLTDHQIAQLCRLRLINLSPELLHPGKTQSVAIS